jgi:hypothetical protein
LAVAAVIQLLLTLIQAYNSIMLVMMGAFFALIGGLIALYPLYTHYRARRYRGEVVGLRKDGGTLQPAVPGMPMSILVKAGRPERYASTGFGWIELGGMAFLVPGFLLTHSGLKNFPVNWLSIPLTLGIVGYVGAKIFARLHPLLAAMKAADWRQETEQPAQWTWLPASEIAEGVRTQDLKARRAPPWFFAIGLGLVVGGAWWEEHRMIFMAAAAIAEGQVIGGDWGSGSSRSTWHASVRFSDAHGRTIIHRDEVGTNPPSFRVGESVRVYYDPEHPERALIDRGMWSRLVPALVALGGILLLLGGLTQYRRIRRRAAYLGPMPDTGSA